MNKRRLLLLLAVLLALRIAMAAVLPFGKNVVHHLEGLNDEPAHFNYVKYLAVHRSFPVLQEWGLKPDTYIRNEFEYHQAPLYYAVCAPLYLFAGPKAALFAGRIFSALAGAAMLWFVALLLRECGYGTRVQCAALLFSGLLFSHVYFTSLLSNDAFSWLFALAFMVYLLRYVRGGASLAATPGLGRQHEAPLLIGMVVTLSLGLLTKSSLLLLLPVAAAGFLLGYLQTRNRTCLVHGGLVLGLSAAIASPWYIRNIVLYHTLSGMPPSTTAIPLSTGAMVGFVKGTVKYFWFPMQHLHGGTVAFSLLCAIGGAILLFHLLLAGIWCMEKKRLGSDAALLLLLLAVNGIAYLWYDLQCQNPEGRFLFPSLGAIAFFMIIPAHEFFVRWRLEKLFIPYTLCIAFFPYPFLLFAG